MVEIKYSVSSQEDIVFVEMYFFDGSIPLQVKDSLVHPIYNILLRYNLTGDFGFPMFVTVGANLNNAPKIENLLNCFRELEANGYLNATELENELRLPCHSEGFNAPRCGL